MDSSRQGAMRQRTREAARQGRAGGLDAVTTPPRVVIGLEHVRAFWKISCLSIYRRDIDYRVSFW